MLTCVVILSRYSRRSPLSRRSLRLPSHLFLFTVIHPLSAQPLTKCSCRDSFLLKTIHFDGEGVPLRGSDIQISRRVSDLSPFFSYSCELFCIHQSLNPFISNQFRTLCAKYPGVGYPRSFFSPYHPHPPTFASENPMAKTSRSKNFRVYFFARRAGQFVRTGKRQNG